MSSGDAGKRERVLILESLENDPQHVVSAIAEQVPSASVTAVCSREDFLQLLKSENFDIVILDHNLPDSGGIELMHELKLKDHEPAVLIVSESSDPQMVASAYDAGCYRYVVKDQSWLDQVGPAIRHLLRLRRLEKENERLIAKLTEANLLLSEKNKRLDEFSGSVAHDIRGPLGGLCMKLEYLLDIYRDDLDQRCLKILQGTLDSSRRLVGIVQAMYELAKLGSKATRMEFVPVGKLLEEVISDLNFDERQDIEIGLQDLPEVWGSSDLLRKVFANLIMNAVKYCDKSPIIINVSRGRTLERSLARFTEIRVQDNGPGIPEEDMDQIFAMFRRGANVEEIEGSGMGLCVVRRIVELHFGKVAVTSTPGKGACFILTLPVEPIDLEA